MTTPFRHSVDIANRALQHCGATLIDETEGFTEDSKRARQTSFAYDKLRSAELRRNVWKFATRKAVLRAIDTDTMILAPALYDSGVTYRPGAIVSDTANVLWISNFPDNLANAPGNSFYWEVYTGPLTVSKYDTTVTYFSGEVVYKAPGDGTYKVYLSLQNDNSDVPSTGTAWDATSTFMKDMVVTRSATAYLSMIDFNINNDPASTAKSPWASGTTYTTGNAVYGTDGYIYTSVGVGNIGHDPVSDGGTHWTNTLVLNPWTATFTGGTGSLKWLEITAALTDLFIIYPIGSGPSSNSATRNIFRAPAAFLRHAPDDPKQGSMSYLGGPSALAYKDWLFEGDYIITSDTGPVLLRFVADVRDVTGFDPMFCEGLAARIALEVCESLTQSTTKMRDIASEYSKFMTEARTVNGIEVGATEPAEDDFITCRQ